MPTLKNIIAVWKDQLPWARFWRNFFVTRNAWGLFHKNSHIAQGSGLPKVMYGSKASSEKAAFKMGQKHGYHYSPYKCLFCDGYHIGRNRDNKQPLVN